MSVYFVARIRITDPVVYDKYLARVDEVFHAFHGTYLAVDASPEVLEGDWDDARLVMIRFDSRDDLFAWYRSEAYQEILVHRLAGAECQTLLVKGLDEPADDSGASRMAT